MRNGRSTVDEFAKSAAAALRGNELCFIGAKVSTERTAVPPFPIDEVENKYRFIRHIEKTGEDRDLQDQSAGELRLICSR